ncbi:helix-turn-helix transcriptional regulator [Bdellovibrionota bacterium FG-2]
MRQKLKPILDKTLKALMKDKGVGSKEVCTATGIPKATLSGLLNGVNTSKPEHLLALSEYFGRSIDFLLFGKINKGLPLSKIPTKKFFSGWAKISVELPLDENIDSMFPDDEDK